MLRRLRNASRRVRRGAGEAHESIRTWSTKVNNDLNPFRSVSSNCLAKTLLRDQEHAQKTFSL